MKHSSLVVGLVAVTTSVKVFGEEQEVYRRERLAGHSSLAYFLGKNTAASYRIALEALHFAGYKLVATIMIDFRYFYLCILVLYYAVYGLGAMASMVVKRQNAAGLGVVMILFAGTFNGLVTAIPDGIKVLSYSFWLTQALFTKQTEPFRHVMQVEAISAPAWDYTLDQYGLQVFYAILIGVAYRIVAFWFMLYKPRRQ
jgi:hypothetical protein